MAEIFDFYVADNRTIKFNPIEPILQEDNRVAVWRFRIPKMLNNIDMSGFAWWFVYVNAAKQKYSEPLTLTADADDPDNYCITDYTIDYGISLTPGSFAFALEAINANGSGDIVEEWHTKTYSHSVIGTLQGNQAEYSETESDIISALMVQIQQKYNALVGGATPIPVASVSQMTNTAKVYLNTTDKNWYYYNSDSSTWVSGGLYASGIVIDPTLTQSGQAADAKVVGDRIDGKVSKPTSSPNGTAGQLLRTNGDGTTQWVDQGLPTDEQTAEAIDEWLTDHPEATTTVQDGAITEAKLADALKLKTIKDYVTPEMFGAVGDGVTDDTSAFANAILSGKAIMCDFSKSYKASINITRSNVFIQNLKLKGTVTFANNLQFITLFNCDIDATNCEYGIYTETNVTKLRLYSVHVHGALVDNIHLHRCWDAMLISVSATGAGNNNFDLSAFNNGYLLGTSYFAENIGVNLDASKACTVIATIQECKKTGILLNNILGSTFRLYLEQNGYEGSDDFEKSQMVIGKTSRCIGNDITFFAIGGIDTDMESEYGVYLQYSEDCTYEGYAEGHIGNGFRCSSNAKGNTYNVNDKTHVFADFDMASCRPQFCSIEYVTPNTLINIKGGGSTAYIPVVRGDVAYMVSFDERSSTQGVVRVTDRNGNNQNPLTELFCIDTGIKTT